MSGVCDVRWCDSTSTELVTFAGQCIGKFCLYHQHQLMRAAGQTVPPDEGRAGYLRFCAERGVTPVPWWDEPNDGPCCQVCLGWDPCNCPDPAAVQA